MRAQAASGEGDGPFGETWLRFGLLVVAAFASAVSIGMALWFAVFSERANRTLKSCAALSLDPVAGPLCGIDDARHRVAFALLVGVAVVILALLGWGVQTWNDRRGLRPFPVPAVLQCSVVDPVLRVGDSRPPLLMWRPDRPISMARANGVAHPYVEVGPNWAGSAVRDAVTARAILVHELHHLRSHDVVPSGTAYWLGPAVGLLGAGYLVQLLILTNDAPILDSVVRVGVIVLVIALGRASVLRSREYEADLAAVRREPEGIRRLLHNGAATLQSSQRAGPLSLHPSVRDRADVIDRPWLTLRPGPTDGLLVGFAAAVGGQVFADLWRTSLPGPSVLLGDVAGWGIAGAALGAWVAAMLLRSEVAATAGPRPRLIAFTALTAIAASTGRVLFSTGVGLPIRWPEQLAFGLAGAVALWLALQALVVWIRSAAESAGPGRSAGVGGGGRLVAAGAVLGGLALGNAGTVATYAGLVDQVGAALGPVNGLVLIINTHATSGPALVLAAALVVSSAAVVVSARRRGRTPRSRGTVVGGVVAGVIGALVAYGFRSLGMVGAVDLVNIALAAQWSVAAVIAVGAIAGSARAGLAPQRACLSAAVGTVTAVVATAVLRADPGAAAGVALLTTGPAVLLSAMTIGVATAVVRLGGLHQLPKQEVAVEH